MSTNPEKDAHKYGETHQKLLETGFRIFSEKTIGAANLTDIANEAGVGVMTVYRHFDKKPDLVLAVSAWVWEEYRKSMTVEDRFGMKASDSFSRYLDAFIDLYRNHPDLLRFNQYFNAYVKREGIPPERMQPYEKVIDKVAEQFHQLYLQGREDGTIRTDIPEKEIFSATMHLMLAAVTRYAVGLVYDAGVDPEQELLLLKKMLMREYVVEPEA